MLVTLEIDDVASVVDDAIERAIGPLLARGLALEGEIKTLRAELLARDEAEPHVALIDRAVAARVAELPPAQAGKDADPALVAELVAQEVERAVAALPVPADGKDAEIDPAVIEGMVTKAVMELPPAPSGRDADPEVTARLVAELVEKQFATLPIPVDGKDADPAVIERMVADAVAALPPAPAGRDADPAVIDPAWLPRL
jgi:hypothetical protein